MKQCQRTVPHQTCLCFSFYNTWDSRQCAVFSQFISLGNFFKEMIIKTHKNFLRQFFTDNSGFPVSFYFIMSWSFILYLTPYESVSSPTIGFQIKACFLFYYLYGASSCFSHVRKRRKGMLSLGSSLL